MLVSTLENLFSPYLRELRDMRFSKAYWSSLHLLLVLPDVCGALQSTDGRSSAATYRAWVDRHLDVPFMGPSDWYHARCVLLHHGHSAGDKRAGHPAPRYDRFVYVDPDAAPGRHGRIEPGPGGLVVTLDIAELGTAMEQGVYRWFRWLREPASRAAAGRVARHVTSLALARY